MPPLLLVLRRSMESQISQDETGTNVENGDNEDELACTRRWGGCEHGGEAEKRKGEWPQGESINCVERATATVAIWFPDCGGWEQRPKEPWGDVLESRTYLRETRSGRKRRTKENGEKKGGRGQERSPERPAKERRGTLAKSRMSRACEEGKGENRAWTGSFYGLVPESYQATKRPRVGRLDDAGDAEEDGEEEEVEADWEDAKVQGRHHRRGADAQDQLHHGLSDDGCVLPLGPSTPFPRPFFSNTALATTHTFAAISHPFLRDRCSHRLYTAQSMVAQSSNGKSPRCQSAWPITSNPIVLTQTTVHFKETRPPASPSHSNSRGQPSAPGALQHGHRAIADTWHPVLHPSASAKGPSIPSPQATRSTDHPSPARPLAQSQPAPQSYRRRPFLSHICQTPSGLSNKPFLQRNILDGLPRSPRVHRGESSSSNTHTNFPPKNSRNEDPICMPSVFILTLRPRLVVLTMYIRVQCQEFNAARRQSPSLARYSVNAESGK
ncbi:hypothetical protein K474DRAFT_1700375 [Panus rudis PR-1116 ss-1]|nr:hypothetical protein K474DRAFT_1700375 [Panus rudis PR-1116 ss-1]